jgi:uncharacterized protein (DUF1697 family)
VRDFEKALAAHGLATDVLLRDKEELGAILAANPFPDAAEAHPNHLLVTFLREPYPQVLLDKLPEIYSGPERLKAIGLELYIDYPVDMGNSKLPQAMAKLKGPKVATGRNWNSVGKLYDLL